MKNQSLSDPFFFIIDAGTQSIRASFIDIHGNIREIVKTTI